MPLWLIWLIGGILLAVGEILTPGFVLGCFAIGCFAASVMAALDFSLTVQVATFSAITFVIFVSARPILVDWLGKRSRDTRTNVDRLIGMAGIVQAEVTSTTGSVKVGGETWSSRAEEGETIPAGSKIRVLRIEGNKLIVHPVKADTKLS